MNAFNPTQFRAQFPALADAGVYLDSAATALKPQAVIDATHQFYDLRAGLLRHHQPGHKVGVMLGDANDNFIAGTQTRTGVTLRHHVDRFGGAACPDDTFFIGRV